MEFLYPVGHNSLGRGSGRGRGASGQPPAAQMSAAGEYTPWRNWETTAGDPDPQDPNVLGSRIRIH